MGWLIPNDLSDSKNFFSNSKNAFIDSQNALLINHQALLINYQAFIHKNMIGIIKIKMKGVKDKKAKE
jgi:hypothetical protein